MADFSYTANEVVALEPAFPVIITQSDNYAKNYQLIDTTPIERFALLFRAIPTTTRNSIIGHLAGTGYGGYASFSWTTVPAHVKSGVTQTVRYVEGTYHEEILDLSGLWNIQLVFEIDT